MAIFNSYVKLPEGSLRISAGVPQDFPAIQAMNIIYWDCAEIDLEFHMTCTYTYTYIYISYHIMYVYIYNYITYF